MPPQLGSPRMLARRGPVCPSPRAGRRAGGLVLLTRGLSESPREDVTCSASAGRSVSSSKNVSLRPDRKHLVLVGARGARRGGGTGTTHFPYQQFQPLTKLTPTLTSLGNALHSPWSSPSCQKQPPRQSPSSQERGATRGREEQKSKTPTHTFPNMAQLRFSQLKPFF